MGPYIPSSTAEPLSDRNNIRQKRFSEMCGVNVSLAKLQGWRRHGVDLKLCGVPMFRLVQWIASEREEEKENLSRRMDAFFEDLRQPHHSDEFNEEVSRRVNEVLQHFQPFRGKRPPLPRSEMKFHRKHIAAMLRAWDNLRPGDTFAELAQALYPDEYERHKYSNDFEKNTISERVRNHYREAERMIGMGFDSIRN